MSLDSKITQKWLYIQTIRLHLKVMFHIIYRNTKYFLVIPALELHSSRTVQNSRKSQLDVRFVLWKIVPVISHFNNILEVPLQKAMKCAI